MNDFENIIKTICKYGTDDNFKIVEKGNCAIPFFGNYYNATVATVSINPSAKEFEGKHVERSEMSSFLDYYKKDPYEKWFGKCKGVEHDSTMLEHILNESLGASYYDIPDMKRAYHFDFYPFASKGWKNSDAKSRAEAFSDFLDSELNMTWKEYFDLFLKNGDIKIVLVNGRSATEYIKKQLSDDFKLVAGPKPLDVKGCTISKYKYNNIVFVCWSCYIQNAFCNPQELYNRLIPQIKEYSK